MKFYVRGNFQHPIDLIPIAKVAESEGLDGITLSDHVFIPTELTDPYPGTADGKLPFPLDAPWPDLWVTAGAIAAVTSRLHIRSDVYILPLRNPIAVARAVSTLAALSDGRFELGVGVGWMKAEFDALEVDYHSRGRRADEAIGAIRALCQAGPVNFEGATTSTSGDLYIEPSSSGSIPIFVGGESPAAIRRAAQLGDGYISMTRSIDHLAAIIEQLRRLRSAARPEKPSADFEIHTYAAQDLKSDDFARLVELGVTSLVITPWTGPISSPPSLTQRLDNLKRYVAETIPNWLDT